MRRRNNEATIRITEIDVEMRESIKEIFALEISLRDSLIINNKQCLYEIKN
jgi:hypothetical protein